MPTLPPRICRCGLKVAAGETCVCQRHRKAGREKARPGARQRGYTTKWEQASKAFLREHPRCAQCGREPAAIVDHIIPHGGDMRLFWRIGNWQSLCRSCHSRKTAQRDGGFGNPLARREARDPRAAVPPDGKQ